MAIRTFVNSNVLLDRVHGGPTMARVVDDALEVAAEAGPLYIDPIVYAKVSVRSPRRGPRRRTSSGNRRAELSLAAAFLASKAFVAYRRRGRTPRHAAGLLHRRPHGDPGPCAT